MTSPAPIVHLMGLPAKNLFPPHWPLVRFAHLVLLVTFKTAVLGHLSVQPPVLFLDEDWPPGRALEVQICTDRRREEEPLELRILNTGDREEKDNNGGGSDEHFAIVPLNASCAGLALNGQQRLDADNTPFPEDTVDRQVSSNPSPATSFSLLFEDVDSQERAALQIELVDVNDNAPRFLGGPFPVQLVIPAHSQPGFLLRRLEVFDPDRGIGGISRFSLSDPSGTKMNQRITELFSLEAYQCHWPKCSVELRLRGKMIEGERNKLMVRARDGAGLSRRRSNEAAIQIWVMAVGEHEPLEEASLTTNGNGQKLLSTNSTKSYMEASTAANLSKPLNSAIKTTQKPPNGTATLIVFDKGKRTSSTDRGASTEEGSEAEKSTERSEEKFTESALGTTTKVPQRERQPNYSTGGDFTRATGTIQPTAPPSTTTATTTSLPPPTLYLIDPLSEDAPVGLELLRIPLPHTDQLAEGLQFVQLDGTASLWMSANGSVRLSSALDATKESELSAEVRMGNSPVALIRAKIHPMVEQFRRWLDQALPESAGPIIRVGQADLAMAVSGSTPIRVLHLPDWLVKYALLEGTTNKTGLELRGQHLLLTNFRAGEHCDQLELAFRASKMRRRVCVAVPVREEPLEVLWPANNSRHFFPENQPFPVLLTFNSSGPPTLLHLVDPDFQDGLLFSISPQSGQLSFRPGPRFDFEQQSQYQLAVLLCQNESMPREKCQRIALWLEVLDANDHCPHWAIVDGAEKEVSIQISEDTRPDPGRPVAAFPSATDGDGTAAQRSVCYRLEQSAGGTFGIQVADKPELYLLKALDREQQSAYQLRVLVTDCPWADQKCQSPAAAANNNNNSLLTLAVSVSDVNDNPPRFVRRHFFAALLLPDVQPGEALLQLRAEDPDEAGGARLRFGWGEGMVQTDGDPLPIVACPFRLNRSSGELSLREDFVPSDLDNRRSFTFRVRVRDQPAPVHEDQASVTISVLDPVKNLLELSLSHHQRDDAHQLEMRLGHLERLLSALLADQGWFVLSHRLVQCGGNCTQLSIYLLDKRFRPVDASLALETFRGAAERNPGLMDELRAGFGLTHFEPAGLKQQKIPSPRPPKSFAPLRRLFSLNPLGLLAAAVLALLALACPFLCCRLLCHSGEAKSSFGPSALGQASPPMGGGVRLVMAKDGSGLLSAENAYIAPELIADPGGQQQRRLRWKADASEDFEFPAPPPVRMYGGSSTLSIPRVRPFVGQSTEF